MVDVLDTGEWTPQQALLQAMNEQDDIECVAIVYMKKKADKPIVVLSSMDIPQITYFGFALQSMALE